MNKLPMPKGLTREEIIDILLKEEYGYLPAEPISITAVELSKNERFCAGKAILHNLILNCVLPQGEFSFPISYTQRKSDTPSPCFVHINFRKDVPDIYQPTEEIIDNGYSVLSFCYEDISKDDANYLSGLGGVVYKAGTKKPTDCGKIGLWAWAAMRVIDYAMTLDEIDKGHINVCGHSRLGKTALLVGALDKRVYCAFSNDSGCSGAALSKEKEKGSEKIADIIRSFSFWFCDNYAKYANNEDSLPFDQHFLLAANAPHRVYVASAIDDGWADPKNEYKSCLLAGDYFNDHGLKVSLPEKMPEVGEQAIGGYIGYHIRKGIHYFSREDWDFYFKYLSQCSYFS